MRDSTDNTSESIQDVSRRRFIKGFSLLVGGTMATQLLTDDAVQAAMKYTKQTDSTAQDGKILSKANMQTLRDICAQVIPKTDTDGAAEVDTHGFIDDQLYHCHTKDEQQMVRDVLGKIGQVAQNTHKKSFVELSSQQQVELLITLEETSKDFYEKDLAAFKFLKGQIVFGYYTSEVGASEELTYLAVPGGFKGSIPYDSVGTSWGSMRSYF